MVLIYIDIYLIYLYLEVEFLFKYVFFKFYFFIDNYIEIFLVVWIRVKLFNNLDIMFVNICNCNVKCF